MKRHLCLSAHWIFAASTTVSACTAAFAQGLPEPVVPGISAPARALWDGSGLTQLGTDARSAGPSHSSPPESTSQQARWTGWLQFDTAYAWPDPGHFSHARTRAYLEGKGAWSGGFKWKLSARASHDAAYGESDHYPPAVRRDQRSELTLREAYVDFSRGDWEFRLGKQNIVWGEVVGLFFADVVSAKDLREFVLPEFDQIRIPQWAARAEWFGGGAHVELVWLPAPEVDRIGKQGAEFYPAPLAFPGMGVDIEREVRPSRRLSNSGFGMRVSTLVDGWDLAGFVYRAPDAQAHFRRSIRAGATPTVVYEARHETVTRVGGTLAKDFDGIVLKAEAVFADGRRFGLVDLAAGDGVIGLKTLDWIVGLDMTPAQAWRVNAQFFQRAFLEHDARIGLKRHENGVSLLLAHAISPSLDAETLGIASITRTDWLWRANLSWKADARTRIRAGVDVFGGDRFGLFGRFGSSDRVWAEYRYNF